MADDRYPRGQRPGEGFRREAPPADQKGDPLSELARLIGSSDPFADAPRKAPPPAPRIADPSTWQDERDTSFSAPARAPRDEPLRASRDEPRGFRLEDDYDEPHPPRHVPGFDDDGTEPEALDTWRPNDPYHHTEGMFPREPQVFADPQPVAPPPPAPPPLRYDAPAPVRNEPPPAAPASSRSYQPPTGYEPRPEARWTPPRPTTPVFDPDDPLGYGRDARAAQAQQAAARPRHDDGDAGRYPPPRAVGGYDDDDREIADLARGIHDPGRDFADPPRLAAPPAWPEASADPRALHPDAYLRERSQGYAPPPEGYPAAPATPPGQRGGVDPAARFGDRSHDGHDDLGDDRYSAEDLAAHYAGETAHRPASKRPRAVIIAAAVFGLCVIGAAGAFGYRMMSSGGSAKPAPVIRADAGPNKVVPANAGGDANKQIYDRLADKGAGERVVSREEQPVEIRDASRPPTPRMVFPNQTAGAAPVATATVQAPPPPTPFATAAAPATGGQEPKKIRTVTVRSDQGTGAPAAAARPASAASVVAAPPSAPRAGASATAPMSLSPAAVPAAPANARAAAVAPPPAPATGGYVVQVSAQKTEAEAQASFRSMQARYPSQLGGRSAIIRRKDTASGTMYGAQIGPFASRDDAVQLCEGLKTAGGSCFVQRN